MIQDVFIIGATGKVGRTLIEHIIKKGDTDVTARNIRRDLLHLLEDRRIRV